MNSRHQIQSNSKQALLVSGLIHGGALLFLLLMILMQSLQKKPPEHVFELVEPTQTADSRDRNSASAPQPENLPELELPQFEDIIEPPPRPRVEIREPTPQPQPEPEPEMMTADQFREQFGEPEPRQRTVRQPQLEVPKIDTSRMEESLNSLVVSTSAQNVSSMNAASQDALSSYISALRSRINAVWEKPEGYTGSLREVVVVFDVAPNGTVRRIRLERGTPSDAFAQSVLAAFRRMTPVGPTPGTQAYTFRMPFRMVE